MPSSDILTPGDLPSEVIENALGVILVILFVALPITQSEEW